MEYPTRKTTRLTNYDYRSPGYYFVTICSKEHKCLFSHITKAETPNEWKSELTSLGHVAEKQLLHLIHRFPGVLVDKYVIMPNHIHIIFILTEENTTPLTQIVGAFKSLTDHECRKRNDAPSIFQRSFHDHVIRNEASYQKIWLYIDANPSNWKKDCFFIE